MDTRVKPAYDGGAVNLTCNSALSSYDRWKRALAMKTSLVANTLMLAGVGIYFGPQIASSLFPLVQEAHIVGVICLVGGLVVFALADQKKT